MKIILILLISLFLTNCSLNRDSQYWGEDVIKKKNNQKQKKVGSKSNLSYPIFLRLLCLRRFIFNLINQIKKEDRV